MTSDPSAVGSTSNHFRKRSRSVSQPPVPSSDPSPSSPGSHSACGRPRVDWTSDEQQTFTVNPSSWSAPVVNTKTVHDYYNRLLVTLVSSVQPPSVVQIGNRFIRTGGTRGMAEFHGFDLAVGETYGYRTWLMDGFGRLRSVAQPNADPWRPGVNVARCHGPNSRVTKSVKVFIDPSGKGRKAVSATIIKKKVPLGGDSVFAGNPHVVQEVPDAVDVTWDDGTTEHYSLGTGQIATRVEKQTVTHDVPDENCGCGFYAYTDTRWDMHSDMRHGIHGLIKATGRTLIGTKGLRTEKAEIIALLDPTHGDTRTNKWRVRSKQMLQRVYPDVPLLPDRESLLQFAPLDDHLPAPDTDEFWTMP